MKTHSALSLLRKEIDRIDKEILNLFCKRFSITKKIQNVKKKNKWPLFQKEREKKILERFQTNTLRKKLPSGFLQKVYRAVFEFSRKKW